MTIDEATGHGAGSAFGDDFYLTGYFEPVTEELHVEGLEIIGELPAGLTGSYLRNGGNNQFAPMGRYHVFDGDGMIHAVTVSEGRVGYRNRWVESKGLLAERRRGRALFGGLSNFVLPDPELAEEIGGMFKNTANTNIISHGGRLLALMEAARPTELTFPSLDTVGEFTFDGMLHGSMTAHPRPDPSTGDLHFFGYSPFPPFLRYHVADRSGRLVLSTEIDIGRPEMMHDFVITERHAVFFSLPAIFDAQRMMAGESPVVWEPDAGARIGVVPLGGGPVSWHEIEPCYVFHFLNAHDAPDGTIVVDGCRSPRMPISFGDDPGPGDDALPSLHRWTIDPSSDRVTLTQLDDRQADFPRVPDAMTGRKNRYGSVGHTPPRSGDPGLRFDGVTQHDLERGTSVTYVYGPDAAAGEPVFAPDPDGSGERDGWYLNFVTDLTDRSARFVVLDARDIEAGPVAEVLLPARVPFGFHGNWVPDLV